MLMWNLKRDINIFAHQWGLELSVLLQPVVDCYFFSIMAEYKHNTSSSHERTSSEYSHSELEGIEKQTALSDGSEFQGNV